MIAVNPDTQGDQVNWRFALGSFDSSQYSLVLSNSFGLAYTHYAMADQTTPPPPLGFLAVEVDIFRPPGDPFNEKTWPFPLIREKVTGTTESQIVTDTAYDDAFIDRFVAAGLKLAERGAIGIITSCGFLAMAQKRYFHSQVPAIVQSNH